MPPPVVISQKPGPAGWNRKQAEQAMGLLVDATADQEMAMANRNGELAKVERKYAEKISSTEAEMARLEGQLAEYFNSQRAALCPDGQKSIRLAHGVLGVRDVGLPALVPLSEKWTWKKIEQKLRRAYKLRFFHKPKPPGIDKNKVKRDLTTEQLAICGMKLEDPEQFYVELTRLEEAA